MLCKKKWRLGGVYRLMDPVVQNCSGLQRDKKDSNKKEKKNKRHANTKHGKTKMIEKEMEEWGEWPRLDM